MKQAVILILLFAVIVNLPDIRALFAGEIDYDPAISGDVTLYATQWCGYCAKTRAFLKKHNVPYTEYDIESSSEAMRHMSAMNAFGVPVIVVGNTVIRGYQPSALADALDSKK
jgi:glutaredoxin-like YruB-family protein